MIKKNQRWPLIALTVLCMVTIMLCAIRYFIGLKGTLKDNAIQDVMNVTQQQEEAFDSFILRDRSRLSGYANYLTEIVDNTPESTLDMLSMFSGEEAECVVMCTDEGWACSSKHDNIHWMSEDELDAYRELKGSGVLDSYLGIFTGEQEFCYYETFISGKGHDCIILKSYVCNQVMETFTLSLYGGRGYGYILDQNGDILLRSVSATGKRLYGNVVDALIDTNRTEEEINIFKSSLKLREKGSMLSTGDNGAYLYTYVPVEHEESWCLLSIVPSDAIQDNTDKMLLQDFGLMMGTMILVLVGCIVFGLLIQKTSQIIKDKDQAVEYQIQLFDMFTNYLSANTDDIYMIIDGETNKMDYVSPNVTRVLGIQPEEVLKAIQVQDMEADAEAARAYYREANALSPGMSAPSRLSERVNPVTGEHRFFLENVHCIIIQGKEKRVYSISDRTRERKSENNLAEALQMARAANDAKSAFLSNISHDIRTPMNAIIGFLALMRDEAENPDTVREYTQRIDAASQHLLGLINDVLDMNKIESGSATLNNTEMSIAEVIDEINTIIRPQAKAKDQTFDIFVLPLKYEHLYGDKLRLNQILINLLSNAVKYTQEGGTIEMRVKELSQVVEDYSRIQFTVRDNGMGMSQDYLNVIFDPFTREETKNNYGIQGTGLGMAITKSLVDLMGGSIHVESEQGKGSMFVVELELKIQEMENDPQFWENYKVARMIVADDEEEACLGIVNTMSKVGVAVDYATDGGTAIQMMRKTREAGKPYDLILLDWKMPNLNGLETARLIRKNYSDKIPILLLTAYDWSDIEQEAREISVNHFMPKPFFMSSFKEAIRRVMGSHSRLANRRDNVVQGMNILVVDDIEVNRVILVKILSTLGATCDTAGTGKEAVDKFKASKPGEEYGLILMDVQMPEMDGYEATRAIRGSGHPSAKSLPIIAMTANAFVDDVRKAIESGMDAHIAKPVQIETLEATIQQVLDSRETNV